MKTIDFITYVLKCNIFHCLASHEASGSKSSLPHKIYIVFCLASQRCKGAVTSKQP